MNEKVKAIPPSGIRKFFDMVSEMKDVVSLGVGEPDFVTPWHIREGSIYALEKGHTSYTSNKGMKELREEIAKYAAETFNAPYDPNNILVTVGVSEAFDLALRALLNPNDEVIIPEPCYVSYKPLSYLCNAKPVVIGTREEDEFELRAEDIEEAITRKTKAIVLNYPNNPTGATLSKKRMNEIANTILQNKIWLISDEIYSELTYDGSHTSFASSEEMRKRMIFLHGFSKAFAMTGFRIGYAAGPEETISLMTKIHQYSMLCAPTMGQMAAIEALRKGKEEMLKMKEEYDQRRKLIVKGLNKIGLNCFMPKGAFYAFPSIKSTGLSSEMFCEELLKKEKVATVPGNAFGRSGEGFIRCSYAASIDEINTALERIEKFINNM